MGVLSHSTVGGRGCTFQMACDVSELRVFAPKNTAGPKEGVLYARSFDADPEIESGQFDRWSAYGPYIKCIIMYV